LFLPLVALAALLASCASGVDPDSAPALSDDGRGQAVLSDADAEGRWPSDLLAIDQARVTGDTLVVAVSHGGGCADHSYQLVVSRIWMESFPVQVPARISHDAHGDRCKALLRRELRISLRPLADAYRAAYRQEHGTVAIRLAGASESLLYSF
jgi:hypothetical protein